MNAGPSYVLRGFALWRHRPGLMLLGMVPALVVSLVLLTAYVVLLVQLPDLVRWVTPFVDDVGDTVRVLVRLSVALVVAVGALALAASTFVALTLLVGDPFYARIWRETERMLGGAVPDGELSAWRAARDAVVLVLVGIGASVLVVVVGFLPVVGTVAGAVLGLGVSGWMLAGDLLGRPLEARGLDAARRVELTRGRRSTVLGFGVTVQVFFLVPLGAVVVMPAAVAGATMLARDLVAERDAAALR
ncbi:EI24 domain-containing protein [Nocardioides sp. 503]|uniref:EI24 domain-containing protein n=1 Tax=Nocardioides sp. 503 TaxID=2508326 RepID=UPI00106FD5B2|nr:EI24 domain-containing protein [Nocardioides sp. 503]